MAEGKSPNSTRDPAQQFEAALARFQDHSEVLRAITGYDLQIFFGYFTLQFALGAWLAEHPVHEPLLAIGLLVADFALAGIAAKLLYNGYMRRREVTRSLLNTIEFLGFRKEGAYLPDKSLDAPTVFRPWWWWYLIGVAGGFIGVAFVLLAPIVHKVAKPIV